MSIEKRKDRKGRILQRGESQRSDGRYEYRFIDEGGERHTIYSWKLVDTDAVPPGKRCAESLRTMEKRVQKDLDDGIRVNGADKVTANERFAKWMVDCAVSLIRTLSSATERCTTNIFEIPWEAGN